ncbi:MAG: DUF2971 domain-containing protein [Prevotellaceae bacterium]|nr:DUF2971 domain-containing protein [Candidatus Faecinaster equi]
MDRHKYQEILESIQIPEGMTQEEMLNVLKPLNIALLQMIPERLYKYRSCEGNHIFAFEKDELWLSTSDLFNDPFDTLIQYDEDKIRTAFDCALQPDIFNAMLNHIVADGEMAEPVNPLVDSAKNENMRVKIIEAMSHAKNFMPSEEQKVQLIIQKEANLTLLPKIAQRFSSVACFSEKIDSILLWSHYSYNHTGFALGYDLRPLLLPNEKNVGLFPVIYSKKRYNAEQYFLYLFGSLMQIPVKNADLMSSIKLLLYKSNEWQYEQEWRLIKSEASNLFEGHSKPVGLKPNSIYYGCHISQENYQRLHEIALRKNLEEHFMKLDNASDEYRMRFE